MQSYLPPIWELFEDHDDVPEFIEGDLIEYDDYYGEYIGCGIIKRFTISEFKNPRTGEFELLPCAIVVSANPYKKFLDYVPMTHIDPLSLSDYLAIYKDEYEANATEMFKVRLSVLATMSIYSNGFGSGYVQDMQNRDHVVSLEVAS